MTKNEARDTRIQELLERHHELTRRERLGLPMTAGQLYELGNVLAELDEMEMAEELERKASAAE